MRIKLLSLLIFLFSLQSFSQQYYPLLDSATNRWTYMPNYMPVRLSDQTTMVNCNYGNFSNFSTTNAQYTGGDTVINTKTYKKLYDEMFTTCLFGFIREDTAQRKVYFLDINNSPEITLYDFSMIPGNTINISFVNNLGYFNSGTYLLDSIVSKVIHHAAGPRRVFYLHCTTTTGTYPLEWVEGIGNYEHLVYPYSGNMQSMSMITLACSDIQYDFYQFLTCFEHMQKVYYDSCARYNAFLNGCYYYQDTCNYWNICGAVHELTSLSSFSMSPNPATSFSNVKIEMRKPDNVDVNIWDITGQRSVKKIAMGKIPDGTIQKQIDVSELANGFYLVECRTAEGSLYRKLIVQH